MSEFNIEGMKCQSCVNEITGAFRKAGIGDAVVTLSPPKVRVPSAALTSEDAQRILSTAGDFKVSLESKIPLEGPQEPSSDERLTPLFVILSYIAGGVSLRAAIAGDYAFESLMNNAMGAFFVVFSLFKILNLSGFADAYATYDILASKSRTYGLTYPFIELALGIAYFLNFQPLLINAATLTLMAIGSIGVLRALRTKRKLQCACLGTALKLPMTKVTLVEDVTMGLMAAVMILHSI